MINYNFFKNNKSKLVACSLAGIMSLGISGCNDNTKETDAKTSTESVEITKFFDVGKHIISEPIEYSAADIRQYHNHPGYKCIDITASNYSNNFSNFTYIALIFINDYPVDVKPTLTDKTLNYNNFGTPRNYSVDEKSIINNYKEFLPGEHILLVRLDDKNIKENQTFETYNGYEIMGISYASNFDPIVLYVNKENVNCEITGYDENNNPEFLKFGTPVEQEKTLTLK